MSDDQAKLVKKESNRYQVLKLFYDEIGDKRCSTLLRKEVIQHFVNQEEMSKEEAESAFKYLVDKNLLKSRTFRGDTSITHSGVEEIEASIKNPKQSTRHFSTQAIQFFFRDVVMGDKFEEINNSTIVNRSKVDNAFNRCGSIPRRSAA